jgi:hypothetical protein
VSVFTLLFESSLLNHQRLRRYTALVHEDLAQTYSRDIQKWLLLAPIVGISTGLVSSAITILILQVAWARILPFYLAHHWAHHTRLTHRLCPDRLDRAISHPRPGSAFD